MSINNILKKREEASKLPEGHYDKKKADEAVDREYGNCFQIEKLWDKRFRRIGRFLFDDSKEAFDICNAICDLIGERRIKGFFLASKDVMRGAAAHYNIGKKEIHVVYNFVSLPVLVHELTHHIGNNYYHGRAFCEMETFLFSVIWTEIIGKKMHSDW